MLWLETIFAGRGNKNMMIAANANKAAMIHRIETPEKRQGAPSKDSSAETFNLEPSVTANRS